MSHAGKRIRKARESVVRTKLYPLDEAVKMVKSGASAKFDETVELALNLGVDPKHADQMVRGVVNLPNGTGRVLRVAVFARGAKADEAKAAGLKIGKKPASGSKTPGRGFVGKVTKEQVREIAEKKMPDLNCATIEAAVAMIEGSARSMGLEVVG